MTTLERVPWMSHLEWEYCRDNLFGENLLLKKKALEHLYIWKVRCSNLPIAVECTLILMDVHLKGCELNSESDEMLTNTMNYESWYSVAIMRFLNLITDSNVGAKAPSSMNQLAKQYEIPDWIVDIRHAVAHGPVLPSLSSLREAVEKCLNWLYESYWSKNMSGESVSNESDTNPSSTFLCFEVCLLLKKYLSYGFESILDLPVSDRQKIDLILSRNAEYHAECSLQEIHKCALKKLGRHLKKSTDYGKKLVLSILGTDQFLISRDALENNELNETFFNFWREIMYVLCDSSVCYHFLLELINIVNSPLENRWRQHCAAVYLNKILENIVVWKRTNRRMQNTENDFLKRKKTKKKSKSVHDLNQPSINDVKLTEEETAALIQLALNKPNENVKIFLKNLLSLSNAPEYILKYDKLIKLIDILTGCQLNVDDCNTMDGANHTVEELVEKSPSSSYEHIFQEAVDEIILDGDRLKNPLNRKDSEWMNAPFGLLPWQDNFQPWLYIYDSD